MHLPPDFSSLHVITAIHNHASQDLDHGPTETYTYVSIRLHTCPFTPVLVHVEYSIANCSTSKVWRRIILSSFRISTFRAGAK